MNRHAPSSQGHKADFLEGSTFSLDLAVDGPQDDGVTPTHALDSLHALLDIANKVLDMDIVFVPGILEDCDDHFYVDDVTTSPMHLQIQESIPMALEMDDRVDGIFLSRFEDRHRRDLQACRFMVGDTPENGICAHVPIVLSDGEVFGFLSCHIKTLRSSLGSRQTDSLRFLARMAADDIVRHRAGLL